MMVEKCRIGLTQVTQVMVKILLTGAILFLSNPTEK